MRVAIMQPTYLPWIGYFDLMDQVDLFIFLDDVSFSKQSWQHRNRIKTPQGPLWLTVPLRHRGRFGQLINEVEISNPDFWRKHLRAVELNYAKAASFDGYFPSLAALYRDGAPWTRLTTLNIALIRWAMDAIGLETETRIASDLDADGVRSARVAGLCHALGARTYLSPIGAADYLLPDLGWFEDVGVEVQFQNYQHPTYEQLYPPFASHVAAVDLILNRGREAIDILRSGRRRPLTPAEVAGRHTAEPALAR